MDTPNVSKAEAKPNLQTQRPAAAGRAARDTFAAGDGSVNRDTGREIGWEHVLVDGEDNNRWKNRHAR